MRHRDWLAIRILGGFFACAIVAGGIALAQHGDDSAATSPPAAPQHTLEPVRTPAVEPSAAPTPAFTATVVVATQPAPGSAPSPTPTRTNGPITMVPASAPNPVPTATAVAPQTADIPKYTDVAVLALAADALVPSGKTFRECVELPHEKWPVPVHLYYEGKGRWLVETHVSEVRVVFDEATGTFTPRNFQPLNPDCR